MTFQPFTDSRTVATAIQPSRVHLRFMRSVVDHPRKLFISPLTKQSLFFYQDECFAYGWVENDASGIMRLTEQGRITLDQS
jgi:hypothetical protein